ncbi:RNA 3'-terminal phosphate cyclase [Nitrososphaera viennensis]|nr:RNA 3'-terminal phosphate cyclase [Nitrososphaera viennensis]UVS70434.1 RNA 3'-terminal phosphate cyclase [Nitrososphaera viennensis]
MEPIKIDGSQGEGGGQILRTAISLSAVTGTPVEVTDIRAKRENPGLRPSHLAAVKVVADLFGARVENLQVGAEWVRFSPSAGGRFAGGPRRVDIGTAGSISLTLMAAIPAVSLSGNGLEIEITGGTDVRASPTTDYMRYVVSEAYRSAGIKFSLDVLKRGYYPKGGGIVKATIEPCSKPAPVELLNGRAVAPRITSVCSQLPKHVAERQISAALLSLEKSGIKCTNYTASFETAPSPGTSMLVYSASDFGGPFVGGDSIGEVGKRAEQVGQEAAARYLESTLAGAAVDPFLADMLVLPMCLAKGISKYRTSRVTEHLRTNLQVARQVAGCKYDIVQSPGKGEEFVITIQGNSA